jgi:alkylation response protein AidB-like acyl-CoA dehydrogenase
VSSAVELELLLDTVDQFGAKAEQRLFRLELPDGDLDAVAGLLAEAASIGLLADVDAEAGRWGVWGPHIDGEGPGLSLGVLRRLGRICAGLATAVHAQGLGVLLLGAGDPPAWLPAGARVGAGFSPPFGIALDPRTKGDGLMLTDGRLNGTARFVLVAGAADAVVLAAGAGAGPGAQRVLLTLPVGTAGLRVVPTGDRIGLRATAIVDVIAEGAAVPAGAQRLVGAPAEHRLRTVIACDWLGQAAVALGCAERAVADASAYTASRIQGGAAICEHAAVRLLLARAGHDVAVVASVLHRHAATPLAELGTTALLRWAADARLTAGEHATRAVTDALQTLGGYGYMDEYGLSKRLRDVTALRVLHGGPGQLLLARHDLETAP